MRVAGRTAILPIATAVLLAIQFASTIRDRHRWPFCAYNMFNRRIPTQFLQLRTRLRDDAGWTEMLPVPGLLPFEFFRVVQYLATIYLGDAVDASGRSHVARAILDGLNDRPWKAWDEIAAAHRPRLGRWTGWELIAVEIDTDTFDPVAQAPLRIVKTLHTEVLP